MTARVDAPIRCPECSQTGDVCTHDQDERRAMCEILGVEPVAEQYDAGDPKAVARAAKRLKSELSQEDKDLRAVMATEEGRRFVFRLLGRCGIYRQSYNPLQPHEGNAIFAEGERSIGLNLLRDLGRVTPEHYLTMLKDGIHDA